MGYLWFGLLFAFIMLSASSRGILFMVMAVLLSPALYGAYVVVTSIHEAFGPGAAVAGVFLFLLAYVEEKRRNRRRAE